MHVYDLNMVRRCCGRPTFGSGWCESILSVVFDMLISQCSKVTLKHYYATVVGFERDSPAISG